MPTTLTGVLLFVVLLLPGFAYQIGKERRGSERTTSVLRETATVVAVSVTSEIFVSAVTSWLWSRHVDFGRLVREPRKYWLDRRPCSPITAWDSSLSCPCSASPSDTSPHRLMSTPSGPARHDPIARTPDRPAKISTTRSARRPAGPRPASRPRSHPRPTPFRCRWQQSAHFEISQLPGHDCHCLSTGVERAAGMRPVLTRPPQPTPGAVPGLNAGLSVPVIIRRIRLHALGGCD